MRLKYHFNSFTSVNRFQKNKDITNNSEGKSFSKIFIRKILLVVVFGIGINTFFFFHLNYNDYNIFAQETNDKNELSIENLIKSGSPILGNLDAPVTILDFSDFQCPNCGRYVKNTEPILNETYIQTGKASLVYKYFPVVGFDSMNPALAGQCSQEQGLFWQFHKLLFANQKSIDSGWLSKDNLKNFASQIIGLDLQKFSECLDGEHYNMNNLFLLFSFRIVFSHPIYAIISLLVATFFWIILNVAAELLFSSPVWVFYLPDDA